MKQQLNKIAAILAFIIAIMAIFAGGKVLLGQDPGYYVINWLPLYNYTVGILTLFLTVGLIWKNHRTALALALSTLGVHGLVMIILQTAYRSVVAPDSIQAMTVRLVVWVIILLLLIARPDRKQTGGR